MKTNLPKVSICVPVYGVEKYIERCAHSLFRQTYENIEYVFVNDCTKDKSIELLDRVLLLYPNCTPKVNIIWHKKNKGLGSARNTAIDNASGEFVLHVDSDDYIDVNCVRLLVECQQKTGADIVYSDIVKLLHNRKVHIKIPDFSSTKDFNIALIRHYIPNNIWGRLIRRELYLNNNIKVEGVNMSEDLNVMPRLIYFSTRIAAIHEKLYFYECDNAGSYTASFSEEKSNQSLSTLNLLSFFFLDKESDYKKALNYRKTISYLDMAKNCVRKKGHKKYYYMLRELMDKLPKHHIRNLDWFDRFAMYLRGYIAFSVYVNFMSIIKRCFR